MDMVYGAVIGTGLTVFAGYMGYEYMESCRHKDTIKQQVLNCQCGSQHVGDVEVYQLETVTNIKFTVIEGDYYQLTHHTDSTNSGYRYKSNPYGSRLGQPTMVLTYVPPITTSHYSKGGIDSKSGTIKYILNFNNTTLGDNKLCMPNSKLQQQSKLMVEEEKKEGEEDNKLQVSRDNMLRYRLNSEIVEPVSLEFDVSISNSKYQTNNYYPQLAAIWCGVFGSSNEVASKYIFGNSGHFPRHYNNFSITEYNIPIGTKLYLTGKSNGNGHFCYDRIYDDVDRLCWDILKLSETNDNSAKQEKT